MSALAPPVRDLGTRIQTTAGPMIPAILIAWSRIPATPAFREKNPPPTAGFAIVLYEDGGVGLCGTGKMWSDIYARTITALAPTPLQAFNNLLGQTALIEQFHKAACWDIEQIRRDITATWAAMRGVE